ncbi:MAG: hypothetical protein ACM336_09945 [Acidobacteriota bacterium]
MQLATLVWGALAFIAMVIGLTPVFRGLNWFTVPFAAFGILASLAALVALRRRGNGEAIVALLSNAIALVIGMLRLRGGFGI